MTKPGIDDEDEKPLDPAAERVRKKLVRFVAINLGLLFFAVMAVLGAVVYKSWTPSRVAEPAGEIPIHDGTVMEADIPLPSGARVMSQSLSGNRIALDAELADGSRMIFLYDFSQRRIVGRLAVKAQ